MTNEQGKLPREGVIKLESIKDQWLLFQKGITPSFSSFGIIEHDGRRLRIEIEFKAVLSPLNIKQRKIFLGLANLDSDKINGVFRAQQFFIDIMDKQSWFIFGVIKGKNQIPITIVYYEMLDIAVYSQKLADEEIDEFLPPTIFDFRGFSKN